MIRIIEPLLSPMNLKMNIISHIIFGCVNCCLFVEATKVAENEYNSKIDSINDNYLFKDIPQINENIWKAINNYDDKLRHKTRARKTGYSKNNQ